MSWQRLLTLQSQPQSLRECYELVEEFIVALAGPAPVLPEFEDVSMGVRLGYLIASARRMAGAIHHPSWRALERRFEATRGSTPACILLAADSGFNPLDDLAAYWGLRKGLDSSKLVEISRQHGAP